MKTILCLFVLLWILPLSASCQNWKLVWSDEFNGDTLDAALWSYQTGTGSEYGLDGWGNNELQYYKEENVKLIAGNLVITAKRENIGNKQFTSGRIRTINTGDWTYGRFEFRAKMPTGKGLWAAIWMLPTDEAYGGWAASGEIDMMEYLGHETSKVYGTLHFGGIWPNNKSKGTSYNTTGAGFDAEFHDFALEWEEGVMRWYVDGVKYQTLDRGDWYTGNADFPAPFDKRFHLLINLAVGGNWPGSPDINTKFPQELVLEYVRIYEAASLGTAETTTGFQLEQNHPNPFKGQSTIAFNLQAMEHVVMELYDSQGRMIQTLTDQPFEPGQHRVGIDAASFSPGLYTYRLRTGSGSSCRQMLIL